MIIKKSKTKHKRISIIKRSSKAGAAVTKQRTHATPLVAKKKSHPKVKVSGLKKNIQLGAAYVGDSVERIGKKIQKSGYTKVGNVIEKIGNRVEHIND